MRAADLGKALAIAEERDLARRMITQLGGDEALHLFIGEGSKASEIALSADYAAEIKGNLMRALIARVNRLTSTLARMGVDDEETAP